MIKIWENHTDYDQKSKLVKIQLIRESIRDFLQQEGFTEVEIPTIYAGRSFNYGGLEINGTTLNGYLRPVLTPYIRRWLLLLKEFNIDKAYYIGHCFRDEAFIDKIHNPCFEILALGALNKNYNYLMKLLEKFILYLASKVNEDTIFQYNKKEINLKNWRILKFKEIFGTQYDNKINTIELPNEMIGDPLFITEFPIYVAGPAKKVDNNYKERAELNIGGIEIGDISTPLLRVKELMEWYKNQPRDIRDYLLEVEQLEAYEENQNIEMTTGAIGLYRLYMILLELYDIRETIAFPDVSDFR